MIDFDLSKVEFSENDIKRNVIIPSKLTPELAYFIGIHVGDGCLYLYKRKTCRTIDYNLSYYGHEIDELEFHKNYILPLIKRLFNIDVWIKTGHKGVIELCFRSKAVFYFLSRVIGLPVGSKKDIDVPHIIKEADIDIKKAFLRGLADTEGCLTFKKRNKEKHYYPAISIGLQSKNLIYSVKRLLDYLKIDSCVFYNLKSKRNGKINIKHQIELNGEKNIDVWFKILGFNSSKHLTKYSVWKNFGFCPPYTNIIERRKILKGEIDINSYYGPVAQPG